METLATCSPPTEEKSERTKERQVVRTGTWNSLVPNWVRRWWIGLRSRRLRVLVAGDWETRSLVRSLLDSDFDITWRVDDGFALLAVAFEYAPDLIVTEMDLPKLDGIEAAARLKGAGAGIPLVILTPHEAPELLNEAMAAGAEGYVLTCDAGVELVVAARAVSQGRLFISHSCHSLIPE